MMKARPNAQRAWIRAVVSVAAVAGWRVSLEACPFCSGVPRTLSEVTSSAAAAVIGKLVELPPSADTSIARGSNRNVVLEVITVINDQAFVDSNTSTEPASTIEVTSPGQGEADSLYLVTRDDGPDADWNVPVLLSHRSAAYLARLADLPESGPDRLAFFLPFLADTEDLLAHDAYGEFANAPYADIKALRSQMNPDRLVALLRDPDVALNNRRLALTMLGVCGRSGDVPIVEAAVCSDDRGDKAALDAAIACYLTLRGPDGLAVIEEKILGKRDAEDPDIHAAVMALRFHGEEENRIPRPRLAAAMRRVLDRPNVAHHVIADLARWEDWSAMDRIVRLFKEADDGAIWVRIPVVKYLSACPLPEAKLRIEELATIDSVVVHQAISVFRTDAGSPGNQ